MSATESRPRLKGVSLILLLAMLQMLTPLSVDLYLPALPSIVRELGTSQSQMQLTLSGYLAGFAAGQLFWGPVGDRYGRKAPMLVGLGLYIAASVGCALAHDVWALTAWRVLQALGGCALPVLGSAMVRDCFESEAEGAQVRSMTSLVGALAPLLAPLIGGQLIRVFEWPMLFWTLALFGAASLAAVLALPETLAEKNRRELHPVLMARGYGELLGDRRYMGYVLPAGLNTAGMLAYISGTPFVYIEYFHVPPQAYGLLFGLNMVGMMGGSALNTVLVRRWGVERMFRLGCLVLAGAGSALAVIGLTGFGGLAALVAGIFVYVAMMGPNPANAAAAALADLPHKAGAASALIGCMGMGLGAIAGALVGWLADGTPRPMTLVMAAIGLLAFAASRFLLGGKSSKPGA